MANKKKSNVVKKSTTKKSLNENNQKKNSPKTTTKKTKDNKKETVKTKPIKKTKKEVEVKPSFHEKLQSFISILFTIVIFILLIFLIFVIYNNYLKPKMKINKEEVCEEYIKKDYNIKKENVLNFINNKRHILYNINKFNRDDIKNEDILNMAKFIIWNQEGEYIRCEGEDKCLVTKKEMYYNDIITELDNFLQIDDLSLYIPDDENDKIRLYENEDKVVLTFSEFEYETLKHDVVDITVDEDIINIYYALSEKVPNTDYYNYVGSKKIIIKYLSSTEFYLESVETNIKE